MGNKSYTFSRFDVLSAPYEPGYIMSANSEGQWVQAQDAIDREAYLTSEIQTKNAQLANAKAHERNLATLERAHEALSNDYGELQERLGQKDANIGMLREWIADLLREKERPETNNGFEINILDDDT